MCRWPNGLHPAGPADPRRRVQATADWAPPADRQDPIALLEEQAAERVPELVPIRYGRMSLSPFSFYRGAAYVMAADLAVTPQTGMRVQLCGDAHLANFGGFASPERQLLFDLVDFDETLPGPWEWDLKRLAASVAVAGRENGFSARRRIAIVRQLTREYREAMRRFATMGTLDVWYARASIADVRELLRSQASARQLKRFDKTLAKGRRKDHSRAFAKLAVADDGEPRIRADPPLIVPIADLVDPPAARRLELAARALVDSYLTSLPHDRRRLLERYHYVDLARKVVGVGSVGTRSWVILLLGQNPSDALFLQAKEAPRSVLERFAGGTEYSNQGRRVVEGQRLMQAASDIFLGWLRELAGVEDLERARPLRPAAVGLQDLRPTWARCGPPTWRSTRGCVRSRSPEHTPGQATRSRSQATSARPTSSTAPSQPSPRPMPSRTSTTTPRSWTPSRPGAYLQSTTSEPLHAPAAAPRGVAAAWQRAATESDAYGSLTTREKR